MSLVARSRAFEYEIRALDDAYFYWRNYHDPADLNKLLLEIFLLHTRILLDFYDDERNNAFDIKATNFIPEWKMRHGEKLRSHRVGLNKALAHLSIERLEGDHIKWPIHSIYSQLADNTEEFLKQANPSDITDDLKNWKRIDR